MEICYFNLNFLHNFSITIFISSLLHSVRQFFPGYNLVLLTCQQDVSGAAAAAVHIVS